MWVFAKNVSIANETLIIKWIWRSALWMLICLIVQPTQWLFIKLISKKYMLVRTDAMHRLNNMDFPSPRLTWLLIGLNIQFASGCVWPWFSDKYQTLKESVSRVWNINYTRPSPPHTNEVAICPHWNRHFIWIWVFPQLANLHWIPYQTL